MKDELRGKILKEFVGLKAKTSSYLVDDNDDRKKAKSTKKWVIKRKSKFEDCKICLEVTHLENKIIHPNNNKIDVKSLLENNKEFLDDKIILTSQQRL